MLVLGIETATRQGSIALAREGEAFAIVPLLERGAHARDLIVRIDGLLREAGLESDALQGIAVSSGPGSFTGVRIGMATAQGLAYALRIGLAGISTLEALARSVLEAGEGERGTVCPAIDAGRGEVYAALFGAEHDEVRRLGPDRSRRPEDLAAELPEGALLAGDGSAAVLRAASEAGRSLRAAGPSGTGSLAGTIARWGSLTLPPGSAYRPGALRPNYVRPSDAEAARRKG